MTYDDLVMMAERRGLTVREARIPYDGYIAGQQIIVNQPMPATYKVCALAEEIGHAIYTVGNILDQTKVSNRKQERVARGWAYEQLIPPEDIRKARKAGYIELWEIAAHLDVSEEFLDEAIAYYKEKGRKV